MNSLQVSKERCTRVEDIDPNEVPHYNPVTKKLSGHYERSKIINLLKIIDASDGKTPVNASNLPRFITRSFSPPTPVKLYCWRIMVLHGNTKLRKALEDGTLSGCFALDITNYLKNSKYYSACQQAIEGSLTCTEFRALIRPFSKKEVSCQT